MDMRKSMTPQDTFIIIPRSVLHDRRLSPAARLLFGVIWHCARPEGWSEASDAELAELMGCGQRKVHRMLRELAHTGYTRMEWAEGGNVRTIWLERGTCGLG